MLQRILVPTDGSEFSRRVLPIVRRLAKAHGAQVLFAQVVDLKLGLRLAEDELASSDLTLELIDALESDAEENLAWLDHQFRMDNVRVRTALLHGAVAGALLSYQVEVQPDLVVMATHARTGLGRLLLGSLTHRMVQEGAAPVLLVGASIPPHASLARALVPLDGSRLAEQALAVVESLGGPPIPGLAMTPRELTPVGAFWAGSVRGSGCPRIRRDDRVGPELSRDGQKRPWL